MLDSFVPTAYRTEFTPWPVSERYAAARNAGTPEAQLLPGELTVHRGDGAAMSYYLDWSENFGPADKPIALRPRYKNSYPQDFVLTVQVRDAQLLFSVSSRSFWEQRDGRAVERGLIARGYLPLDAPGTPRREEDRHEEAASSPAISSAPPLLGWDITDIYPARMALIRALCEGLCASLTAQATALAPGEARVDEREDRLQAVHLNASARPDGAETGWETPAGMVRALIIEQDESAGGEARAYYANVLSPPAPANGCPLPCRHSCGTYPKLPPLPAARPLRGARAYRPPVNPPRPTLARLHPARSLTAEPAPGAMNVPP